LSVPTESFKTLQAAFEAWNRRDIDAVLQYLREDVVWRTGRNLPDVDAVYKGHSGVRRFFREFMEPWDEISVEILDVIEDREDQVVVRVKFHARGREGIELDTHLFQIYRYDENHRGREFHAFPEDAEEEALREAGLE
jgi:ketosteroid isomerase-like protein